jgi:hypothetical protein
MISKVRVVLLLTSVQILLVTALPVPHVLGVFGSPR